MKPLFVLFLLAMLLPVGGHAQQRIENLITELKADKPELTVKTIVQRNSKTLKLENETRQIIVADKEWCDRFRQAFKEESEKAVVYEHNEGKDESYLLRFETKDRLQYNYWLTGDFGTGNVTLRVVRQQN